MKTFLVWALYLVGMLLQGVAGFMIVSSFLPAGFANFVFAFFVWGELGVVIWAIELIKKTLMVDKHLFAGIWTIANALVSTGIVVALFIGFIFWYAFPAMLIVLALFVFRVSSTYKLVALH